MALITACGSSDDDSARPDAAGSRLQVAATIYAVTYFTERVAGDRAEVTPLVKPGVEAHDFEPAPSDIRAIASADVVVFNHPVMEAWMPDALEAVGGERVVVQASDAAPLMEEEPVAGEGHGLGPTDPHVWLNPVEAIEQVRRIQAGLTAADPDGAAAYSNNADTLIEELDALDTRLASALSECRHSTIVVSHLAYGHLADRYGLIQVGLSGLASGFEASPRAITDAIDLIDELGLEYVLQEPISESRLAETVARETGATILELHPLESLTPAQRDAGEDFFSVMDRNIAVLVTALDCDR